MGRSPETAVATCNQARPGPIITLHPMPIRPASAPFTLDSATLERLFEAYGVPLPAEGLVLFALRGGVLESAPSGWAKSVRVRPAPIDHIHMRCAIGIWDRAARRLFAAPGSTVPHRDNVRKAAERKGRMKGKGTNQLEPGYYTDLAKGEHLQGKANGHAALRQTASRLYRRAPHGLPYGPRSPLYYGNPYDNLHCGWNLDGQGPGFSSAGCMVVAGMPRCPRRGDAPADLGPWKAFHDRIYAVAQRAFPILLVPAAEAGRLVNGPEGKKALIYGSEGEGVEALQRRLAARGSYRGRITGKLDARTYRAWKGHGKPRSR
jgi:hypothetical protein